MVTGFFGEARSIRDFVADQRLVTHALEKGGGDENNMDTPS